MKLSWTPRVWSQGSADSGDLLSYPSLPELESFYRELQNDFAGSVALELAGHSVRGQPIWLLTITDQDVSDEDKTARFDGWTRTWAGTQRKPGFAGVGALACYACGGRNSAHAMRRADAGGQPGFLGGSAVQQCE